MDNLERIKQKTRMKLAISRFQEEETKYIQKNKPRKEIIVASLMIVFLSGIVFAKDIGNYIKQSFWHETGIKTAIDNGYVGTPENEVIEQNVKIIYDSNIIDTIYSRFKIGNFIMTDNLLKIETISEFDNKLNNYIDMGKKKNGTIDLEGSYYMELMDAIITDENNNTIYANNVDDVTNYKSISTGIREISVDTNTIICHTLMEVYSEEQLPYSRTLNISFNRIKFSPKDNNTEKEIILEGDWKFSLNIPEEMYNRESIEYKAIEYDNKDFDVYKATLNETCFELGIKIHNIERQKGVPEELKQRNKEIGFEENYKPIYSSEEEFLEVYGDKKYLELFEEYFNSEHPIRPLGMNFYMDWKEKTNGCYVINSNGTKFGWDGRTGGQRRSDYENETTYNFLGFFEMTKYDATDEITVVIDYKGEPIKIRLQKDT